MAHQHADRLIYAADINFDDCADFRKAHIKATAFLANTEQAFRGLGITIKGNTLFRFLGSIALSSLEAGGYGIFGDYKLFDVRNTIDNDASWLRLHTGLKILTVNEDVHPEVFKNLAASLPDVIIAPINPLTDLEDTHFKNRGEISREHAVREFFSRVYDLPANGVICSPKDLNLAPPHFAEKFCVITPAIRPAFAQIKGDRNAANALTPRKAILSGASRLVVGSPIRHQGRLRENAERILDEIGEALIERNGG